MTLANPHIKQLIASWQEELRALTDNNTILLVTFHPPAQPVDFKRIAEVVCDTTGIPISWARGRGRKRETVLTRHLIAYYACQYSDMTLAEIGKALGSFDHTTVLHAREKVKGLLETGDHLVCTASERINKRLAGSPLPA